MYIRIKRWCVRVPSPHVCRVEVKASRGPGPRAAWRQSAIVIRRSLRSVGVSSVFMHSSASLFLCPPSLPSSLSSLPPSLIFVNGLILADRHTQALKENGLKAKTGFIIQRIFSLFFFSSSTIIFTLRRALISSNHLFFPLHLFFTINSSLSPPVNYPSIGLCVVSFCPFYLPSEKMSYPSTRTSSTSSHQSCCLFCVLVT